MVKILLATDIHHPSDKLFIISRAIETVRPDAIIISGDLSVDGKVGDIEELFRKLRKVSKNARIIAVLGNHDLYLHGGDTSSVDKVDRIYKHVEKYNVELLDVLGNVELGDYRVVGNVCWYDYSFAPGYKYIDYVNCNPYGFSKEYIKENCLKESFDLCRCPSWHNDCMFTDIDAQSFAKLNKEKIKRDLKGNSIIVTHHVPLKDLIVQKSFFNAYDGQDMSDLLDGRVKYYIYGHLHDNSIPKKVINGITFINAFKYQISLKVYIQNAVLEL
ncbi:metallophosphoesterase [Acidianus sp. HS-5]|uniref:metallophosphoesterase family protein n=1 Tax=Acidianus sp. HS-5 TaxID=2886040 RepID=UPI001F3CAECF|nr:metallophosphoesterase [Acidianus sp. HS-5]BDC17559.1 hypothetical protein HS5_04490 [Acidianus sp. HS-5]